MKQNVIIAVVVAIVLAGVAFWFVGRNKATAPVITNTNEVSQPTGQDEFIGDVPGDEPDPATIPSSTTIAVSPQIPGDSATIDNVFLEKAGFVVIHEADSKGQPGAVIGSSGLLGTGPRQDLEINASLKPGGKYLAKLYEDNGDKKFNMATDKAVLNNNKPVMAMFSVSQ
jgi:hypothetical protein